MATDPHRTRRPLVALAGELAAFPPFTVLLSDRVVDAAEAMREKAVGDVIVVGDDGRVAGMLTDRDVTVRVVAEQRDPIQTTVGAVCTPDPVTIEALATVDDAERLMREHVVHRLPVVDHDGRPLGLLSLEDLAASGYVEDSELRQVLKTIARAYWRRSAAVP
jgi:CBS domain-containing protein